MTKKLVTILAEELPEWPDDASVIVQEGDKEIYTGIERLSYDGDSSWRGLGGYFHPQIQLSELATDWKTSQVTHAQWEAERARILLESQQERDADVAKVVDCVAARSDEDQALWDKVAIAAMNGLLSVGATYGGLTTSRDKLALDAFAHADAFMAERAKRMKG